MNKTLALALSLSLPLPAAAEWSDAVVQGLQGARFQRAVIRPEAAARLGHGFTLTAGAADFVERLRAAGAYQRVVSGQRSLLEALQDELELLGRRTSPTVVSIVVKTPEKSPEQEAEDQIEKYFGKPDSEQSQTPAPQPSPRAPRRPKPRGASGSGSGVIVDNSDGKPLIVTNAHVVASAGVGGEVEVYLQGDKTNGRKASVLGFNSKYDLAIVKMSEACPACAVAPLGTADVVKANQLVLAIGAPLGLNETKTLGIVSYVGRHTDPRSLVEDMIQTDAAINPGNSGGPLFNIYGRVIGINTMIASPNGGSVGLGFAIPVRHVAALIERWKKHGVFAAARIGVEVGPSDDGAVFGAVEANGPAAQAGAQKGDLLLKIDGAPAPKDVNGVVAIIANKIPGRDLKVTVKRAGKPVDLTIKLGSVDTPPED